MIYVRADTIYNSNWELDTNKFTPNAHYVIDFSSEHYGQDTVSNAHQQLTDMGIDFDILTYNPKDHLVRPNIHYNPYYYYYTVDKFKHIDINNDQKKYKLSCLNGNPRFHRIYNYIELRQKSYFGNILFSMHNDDYATRPDDYVLPDVHKKTWGSINLTLKSRENMVRDECTRLDTQNSHEAYINSYVNLVTETTVIPNVFVTEKTWKPIASGQLFLIIGNCGIVDHLRDVGVDVYDDILDHKYYDAEPDWQSRIQKVHKLLDDLMTQDLQHINQITLTRRQLNSHRFFSREFNKQYVSIR